MPSAPTSQGNGATMLHRLPYSAINFWAYERITELWNRRYPSVTRGAGGAKTHNYSLDVTRRLAAGGAAGMCACTVVRLDQVASALGVQGGRMLVDLGGKAAPAWHQQLQCCASLCASRAWHRVLCQPRAGPEPFR